MNYVYFGCICFLSNLCVNLVKGYYDEKLSDVILEIQLHAV